MTTPFIDGDIFYRRRLPLQTTTPFTDGHPLQTVTTLLVRYKNKYFVERNEGLLIVPRVAYEHQEEIRAIQESLFKLK